MIASSQSQLRGRPSLMSLIFLVDCGGRRESLLGLSLLCEIEAVMPSLIFSSLTGNNAFNLVNRLFKCSRAISRSVSCRGTVKSSVFVMKQFTTLCNLRSIHGCIRFLKCPDMIRGDSTGWYFGLMLSRMILSSSFIELSRFKMSIQLTNGLDADCGPSTLSEHRRPTVRGLNDSQSSWNTLIPFKCPTADMPSYGSFDCRISNISTNAQNFTSWL